MNESFFSFKGHLPLQFASTNPAEQKDPCALVYPAGLWKTPTSAEIGTLTSNTGVVDGLLGDIVGLLVRSATPGATSDPDYIEYQGATGVQSTVYPAAANRLRFYNNGIAVPVSAVLGIVQVNLGNVGESSGFWSSDQLLTGDPLLSLLQGLHGVASVGATSYIGATPWSLLTGRKPIGTKAAGLLNINVLNLGIIQSDFMNVRCTRNASWNGSVAGYNPMPTL